VGLHAWLRRIAWRLGRARGAGREALAVVAATLRARGAVIERTRLAGTALARRRLLARFQQQRRIALHQARQGRGDLAGAHVVLAGIAVHQLAVRLQAAGLQRAGDALEEARHAAVVDRVHARQAHLLDRLPGGALDRTQHALLARGDEQDRLAAAAGTASAADT